MKCHVIKIFAWSFLQIPVQKIKLQQKYLRRHFAIENLQSNDIKFEKYFQVNTDLFEHLLHIVEHLLYKILLIENFILLH